MWLNVLTQLFHVAVWLAVVIGSVIFLRRGYSGGAVSTLIGAVIMMFMGLFHTGMTVLIALRVFQNYPGLPSIFTLLQIPHLVGMILFAAGFLQLARATR